MDRKFYTDSFEKLLKERSDEFRMYPVRKVWHSVYNNLYPGRRWPSLIMTITMVCAISLVNFLNTNPVKTSFTILKTGEPLNNFFAKKPASSFIDKMLLTPSNDSQNNLFAGDLHRNAVSAGLEKVPSNTSQVKNILSLRQHSLFHHNATTPLPLNKSSILLITGNSMNNNLVTSTSNENNIKKSSSERNGLSDYYFISNDHLAKKWRDKLVLQIYASPYVGYGEASGQKMNSIQGQDNNNNTFDNSSIGLEAGTAMQYSLSDLIKLKAGLQFNYASYNMEAYQNDISNDMSDIIPKPSGFSNNAISTVTLHNEMYQFSLPVGVEFKLLQNNNLQWNAGATIQPTFIAGGNTYLLSSDTRSFIDESSALNKWNFNAGLETFITYKINGLTWQFGPQLRYQFSSIYNKVYTAVDEKLINVGVKIGVSKVLH